MKPKHLTDDEWRARRAAYMRAWGEKNRAHVRAWQKKRRDARGEESQVKRREYRKLNGEAIEAKRKEWLTRNPGKSAEYGRRAKAKDPQKYQAAVNRAVKAFTQRARFEALSHYSRGAMACACCATTYEPHLTIDHVNMDGAAERRVLKASGHNSIYATLRKRGWPAGYRVLCLNCNRDAWNRKGECGCQLVAQVAAIAGGC